MSDNRVSMSNGAYTIKVTKDQVEFWKEKEFEQETGTRRRRTTAKDDE